LLMRFLKLALVALLALGLAVGCGKREKGAKAEKEAESSTEIATPAVGPPAVRRKADANARSAGRMAKMAEEMYYASHSRYTNNLEDLEFLYHGITEDEGVTFIWGVVNEDTFKLTVKHKNGSGKTYVFSD